MKHSNSSKISIFTIITIVFIVLKLVGVINWSWWLVLLPAYGSVVIGVIALLILIVCRGTS